MGLAASQARLLSLTSRIHDVEFEAQQLQYAKLKLAMVEDDVLKRYEEALDAETLTMPSADGKSRIKATFNNLCGLGSINNNIGRNHYIFRNHGQVMVPHDVYTNYSEYGGSDPYDFAMYMMGVNVNGESDENGQTVSDSYQKQKELLLNSCDNKRVNELYKNLNDQIKKIFDENKVPGSDTTGKEYEGALKQFQTDIFNALISDDITSLKSHIGVDMDKLSKDINIKIDGKTISLYDLMEQLSPKAREIENLAFKANNGAERFYSELGYDSANFDKKLFDYYVRWAQIIINEGGIDACIDASCGEDAVEENAELLNQYIMFGKISIDAVYDDGKGGISDFPTSNATDTVVYMDKEEKVDSTAVKKAEAERDRKLKEINRIDKNYDLTLNRLETERTALTTEYDSVKKVISDNVERTFGIFS